MRTKLLIYEILSFLCTAIAGTLLCTAYDDFNHHVIVGIFTPINESVWEILKLFFVPYAVFLLLEYLLIGRRFHNFLYYKCMSMLLGLCMYIGGFYIYSGIIGQSFELVDRFLFYFSIFICCRTSYRLIRHNPTFQNYNFVGGMILFTLSLLFIIFTFMPPPPINLFHSVY